MMQVILTDEELMIARCGWIAEEYLIQWKCPQGGAHSEFPNPHAGRPGKTGCLLARCQLSRRRTNLSPGQCVARALTDARRREAYAAGTLGYDARPELYLRAPEPS